MRQDMTPDMDKSAHLLTELIKSETPFSFWRFGDGAIECMYYWQGVTCDGERYSREMGEKIRAAIKSLHQMRDYCPEASAIYFGDWATATNGSAPNHVNIWRTVIAAPPEYLLHFEALLLNRQSHALHAFYRAVKQDRRRKLIVGAEFNRPAGELLNADYLAVPLHDLYECLPVIAKRIQERSYDVLLFGCGLAGVLPIVAEWQAHPERTYIHLGSALDPLHKGRTRSGQLGMLQARAFLGDL